MTIGSPVLVTSCAFLKGGITVVGEMGAAATIIDGGHSAPNSLITMLWTWEPDETVVLNGLTIAGGNRGTVEAFECGTLAIRDCRIIDFVSNGPGGEAISAVECNLILLDSEVSGNATWNGTTSACRASGFSFAEIRRCRFENNFGTALGLSSTFADIVVEDCVFVGNRANDGAGLAISGGDGEAPASNVTIERNLFLANSVAPEGVGGGVQVNRAFLSLRFNTFAFDSCSTPGNGGGLAVASYVTGEVSNNTFYGCHAPFAGAAVKIGHGSNVEFRENVVSFSSGGPALYGQLDPVLTGGCNVLWANAGGDFFSDWSPFPTDLFTDPQFCDPSILDFSVSASSPCAPGNSPGCGSVGAWGVGCGIVSVEESSWAKIKALYR